MTRVGQNHIYTVYKRCFWQKSHHTYSHIRCKYTVLANPTYDPMLLLVTKKRTCHEVHNNSISSKATRENESINNNSIISSKATAIKIYKRE